MNIFKEIENMSIDKQNELILNTLMNKIDPLPSTGIKLLYIWSNTHRELIYSPKIEFTINLENLSRFITDIIQNISIYTNIGFFYDHLEVLTYPQLNPKLSYNQIQKTYFYTYDVLTGIVEYNPYIAYPLFLKRTIVENILSSRPEINMPIIRYIKTLVIENLKLDKSNVDKNICDVYQFVSPGLFDKEFICVVNYTMDDGITIVQELYIDNDKLVIYIPYYNCSFYWYNSVEDLVIQTSEKFHYSGWNLYMVKVVLDSYSIKGVKVVLDSQFFSPDMIIDLIKYLEFIVYEVM